jgi:ribonuclease P protein component
MVSAPVKPLSEAAKYWQPAAFVAARSSLPEASNSDPLLAEGSDSNLRDSAVTDSTAYHARSIEVIRKRSDFLAANRGKRFVTPNFILLAHKRRPGHPVTDDNMRYGITITKKIGNAVTRNRMKRRFRALLAELLPELGISGVDHIMIGRKQNDERDFEALKADLEKGLRHLTRKLS